MLLLATHFITRLSLGDRKKHFTLWGEVTLCRNYFAMISQIIIMQSLISNYINELLKYEKLELDNKHTISLQNEGRDFWWPKMPSFPSGRGFIVWNTELALMLLRQITRKYGQARQRQTAICCCIVLLRVFRVFIHLGHHQPSPQDWLNVRTQKLNLRSPWTLIIEV